METLTLHGDAASSALAHPDLVPPSRPAQFTAGATAELRDAMARFSGPDAHAPRRAAISELLSRIDLGEVTQVASTEMQNRLHSETVDIVAASWVLPSYTLATVLGMGEHREQVRADTASIARVIGRNEPSSADSDSATTRLLDACAGRDDPIAAVSILYQNHDATSGLIRSAVHEAFSSAAPTSAGSTVRVATNGITIEGVDLRRGDTVRVDLTHTRYGSGPHECPGEALAWAITTGAIEALRSADFGFVADEIEVDSDGFPTRFVMHAPR